MQPKVVPVGEARISKRKSPATRIIESLNGEYETMASMAARYGVHVETMRRLCKTTKVKAPSKALQQGDLVIYLFTDEDVAELDAYMEKKGVTVLTDGD